MIFELTLFQKQMERINILNFYNVNTAPCNLKLTGLFLILKLKLFSLEIKKPTFILSNSQKKYINNRQNDTNHGKCIVVAT